MVRYLTLAFLFVSLLLGVLSFPVRAQVPSDRDISSVLEGQEASGSKSNALSAKSRDLRKAIAELEKAPEQPPQSSLGTMVKGLGLCLAVFFIGLAIFQRLRRPVQAGTGRRMRVKERLLVSPRTSVLLLEVDGRDVLMSLGPDQTNFLPVGGLSLRQASARRSAPIPLLDEVAEDTGGQRDELPSMMCGGER